MFIELQVKSGASEKKVFLRTGQTKFPVRVGSVHSHSFVEVHIVIAGSISFESDGKTYRLAAGDLLALPPDTLHRCAGTDSDLVYANFYVDTPLKKTVVQKIDPAITAAFLREHYACQKSRNYAKLSAFIALLICHIFEDESVAADRMTNHSMAIDDYFLRSFANASLSELAGELFLSEKQTERLVVKYTGRTFKQNVAYHRIQAATALLQAGRMSKKAVAEYVGYATYGGFYKALREYGKDVGPHRE